MEWNIPQNGWHENEQGNTIIEVHGNRVLAKRGLYIENDCWYQYTLRGNYLTVMANQAIGTTESRYFELSFIKKTEDEDSPSRDFAFGLGKDLPECGDPTGDTYLGWKPEHMKNYVSFHVGDYRIRNRDEYLYIGRDDESVVDSGIWFRHLENDIFGCGVDHLGKVYFTWNGKQIEFNAKRPIDEENNESPLKEPIDKKFEEMVPFISVGIQDIEIVANFGQQAFLYNPHRSLAYTWRNEVKYLSESKFLGFGTESMNFFDNLTDVSLVSTSNPDYPETIKCHGLVLSCRSTFFKEMFEKDGFKNREIEIPHVAWKIKQMVKFMYTDSLGLDEEDDHCDMLSIAKEYKIEGLESYCTDQILRKLDQIEVFLKSYDYIDDINLFVKMWDAFLECGSDRLAKRCEDILIHNWQHIKGESGNESMLLDELKSKDKPAINRVLTILAIETSIPDKREMWRTDGEYGTLENYRNTTDTKIRQYLVETCLTKLTNQKPMKQNEGFAKEWNNLLKEKPQSFFDLFNDVTIVCKGEKELKSSRLFLSLQSKVLRKLIESKEADDCKIEISKFSQSIIKRALRFLFTDSMLWNVEDINVGEESDDDEKLSDGRTKDNLSLRKVYGVLCFAIEYEIESLKTMCIDLVFQEFSRVYQPTDIKAFWKICKEDENKQTARICELLINRNWNLTKKQELIDFFPYYYWERKFLDINCGVNYFDDFSNDVLIVSKEEEEISCHRLLLSRQSTNKLMEPSQDDQKIDMKDCSSSAIKQMVDFIQCGEVKISSTKDVNFIKCFHDLLCISIKYEIPSLEWYCSDKLMERLQMTEEDDPSNMIGRKDLLEIWKTAIETGSKLMKGRCISFFKDYLLDMLPKNLKNNDENKERGDEDDETLKENVEDSDIERMMAKDRQTTFELMVAALSYRNDEETRNNLLELI